MSFPIRPALVTFLGLTLICGVVYPLLVTGAARTCFPAKAKGSLLRNHEGVVVGSSLIGQHTEDPRYFWGRLSATADYATNASNSGGSNLSGGNPDLRKAAQGRIDALHAADPGNNAPVPVDLITASGSGLDPHISPLAAHYQITRVAKLRGLSEAAVTALVERHTQGRQLGIFGEPRVNVLELNLALDSAK